MALLQSIRTGDININVEYVDLGEMLLRVNVDSTQLISREELIRLYDSVFWAALYRRDYQFVGRLARGWAYVPESRGYSWFAKAYREAEKCCHNLPKLRFYLEQALLYFERHNLHSAAENVKDALEAIKN